jgi:hypothetical protein
VAVEPSAVVCPAVGAFEYPAPWLGVVGGWWDAQR